MRRLERTLLPNPYVPLIPNWDVHAIGSSGVPASGTVVGSNNLALYMPVVFPADVTVYELRIISTTATGNYDIGLYDDQFRRLASSGSVALSNAVKTLALPDLRLKGGLVYYQALSLSNLASTLVRWGSVVRSLINAGVYQEASAVPLPATATPVQVVGGAIPLMIFGVR